MFHLLVCWLFRITEFCICVFDVFYPLSRQNCLAWIFIFISFIYVCFYPVRSTRITQRANPRKSHYAFGLQSFSVSLAFTSHVWQHFLKPSEMKSTCTHFENSRFQRVLSHIAFYHFFTPPHTVLKLSNSSPYGDRFCGAILS